MCYILALSEMLNTGIEIEGVRERTENDHVRDQEAERIEIERKIRIEGGVVRIVSMEERMERIVIDREEKEVQCERDEDKYCTLWVQL